VTETQQLLLLAGLWLLYFAIHSVLASLSVKRWVSEHRPGLMPAYRLIFNLIASLFILPPLALTIWFQGDYLWRWTGFGAWVVNGLTLLALAGFVWSTRFYDSSEFFGFRQWREKRAKVEDQESFQLSPLHRYVRHPWYSLGLALIWTRDMDPAFLLTAVVATAYFIFGAYLEEKKLMVYHGDIYREYRRLVPGLIPLPWRYLTKAAADDLVQRHAGNSSSRH